MKLLLHTQCQLKNNSKISKIMNSTWISNHSSLIIAAGLAVTTLSSQAQSVAATGALTDVAGAGGVFDYTFTLDNTGTEAIESFWLGWFPGSFNVASPTSAGNTLGWNNVVDGNSIQFGGTSATALAPGGTAIFTFDSTSTPAQFESGPTGKSTVYGVDFSPQFSLALPNPDPNAEVFSPTFATPEPSTYGLMAVGALALSSNLRRKFRGQ
jgi:hypothetical protein